MHKVVVERPRWNPGPTKRSRRANRTPDQLPRFESVRAPHARRKSFTDLLGPLRRWLRAQVGRRWDDVYSEACRVIKPDSVVRAHIKTHLLEFVQRNTFMRGGRVWCFAHRWDGNELPVDKIASRGSPFCVHPETRLLAEASVQPRVRWRDQNAERRGLTQRRLNDRCWLRQLRGIWFACEMETFPPYRARSETPWRFDLAERRLINRGQAYDLYGRTVHCVAKRQLSSRELRRFGLSNSTRGIPTGAQPSAGHRCDLRTIALRVSTGCRVWMLVNAALQIGGHCFVDAPTISAPQRSAMP